MLRMSQVPKALVIRAPGTNCDAEMCRAFEVAGASVELAHIDRLAERPDDLDRADLIGFPGGFSYGDDVASGRLFAARLRQRLYPALRRAATRGVPMIGACNGFQVLVQLGLLPGPLAGEPWPEEAPPAQRFALTHNQSGRFIDRWVRVTTVTDSVCVWTRGLQTSSAEAAVPAGELAESLMLPIAHGEGRFVAESPTVLDDLARGRQIALRYAEPTNGSEDDVAGICDASGRIFGLMPHPERFLDWHLHPFWTRLEPPVGHRLNQTPGLMMFRNAVEAAIGVTV